MHPWPLFRRHYCLAKDFPGELKTLVRTHEKKHGRHIDADFETELVSWMAFEREARHPISRKALVQKALSYGRQDFKASLGWLDKFLKRNGYSLRRATT